MILDPQKTSLSELAGQLESFGASCEGTVTNARGEVEGLLGGLDAEIQGIRTEIDGALGRAVGMVSTVDQELEAIEP